MTSVNVPKEYSDLVEKRALAYLATIMPDGSPQVTPVWFDMFEGHFRVNTARGRQKDRNMTRDPRVALSIQDPEDPYRYMQVRGVVVETTEESADGRLAGLRRELLKQEAIRYLLGETEDGEEG